MSDPQTTVGLQIGVFGELFRSATDRVGKQVYDNAGIRPVDGGQFPRRKLLGLELDKVEPLVSLA
jgi:hypothetical protein